MLACADLGVWTIGYLTWWNMPRRAWVIILTELGVIIIFSAGFASEYLNNTYFQNYVNSIVPILIPVISVTFGVCSATVATFLYFGTRRITQTLDTETVAQAKRRTHTRKTVRKIAGVSEQRPVRGASESPMGVPRPRFIAASPSSASQPRESGEGDKESE